MMNNEIRLCFDKKTTRLAGNPYGRSVFGEQVEDKINYDTINIIIFPENIEKVASSFVQGFFSSVVETVGYAGFDKVVLIKARSEQLAEDIRKDLFV